MLFGVADGVGGLPGGAAAAQAAVDAVRAGFSPPSAAEPDLAEIVLRANAAVAARGRRLHPLQGIATTLTFGRISGDRLRLAHVGDSRCYVVRGRALRRLTEDHSVANEARRLGAPLKPGFGDPRALVRCLGQMPDPGADLFDLPLEAGERYLFCTDGVTGMLEEDELGRLVGAPGPPAGLLDALVAACMRRGGHDDMSGVLVFIY